MILAIDPGCTESAWVRLDGGVVRDHGKCLNETLLSKLHVDPLQDIQYVAIEMISSYGMPVGREVFETCLWIGRFYEAWVQRQMRAPRLIYRRDVKLHVCNSVKANDANIRAALIDQFGGNKEAAIGRKTSPGPLYGITADRWAALAVALTAEHAIRAAA